MGAIIKIHLEANDDVMITEGIVQYRLNSSEQWEVLYSKEHQQSNFYFKHDLYCSNTFEWIAPVNIEETQSAQVRVLLYVNRPT